MAFGEDDPRPARELMFALVDAIEDYAVASRRVHEAKQNLTAIRCEVERRLRLAEEDEDDDTSTTEGGE